MNNKEKMLLEDELSTLKLALENKDLLTIDEYHDLLEQADNIEDILARARLSVPTKIMFKIRKQFPNVNDSFMEEIAADLVELESQLFKKIHAENSKWLEDNMQKIFESGLKHGRAEEKKQWLGWEIDDKNS